MQRLLRTSLVCLATVFFGHSAVAEPQVIFLVRHAERADAGGPPADDPALSAMGEERAIALARCLRDARISAIYTSEFQRTQQTAAPLAASLGLKTQVLPAKETASLIAQIKRTIGNVLLVGHSNTLPEVIKALGIPSPITIAEKEYDDLFIVVLEQPPRLIHLHYR